MMGTQGRSADIGALLQVIADPAAAARHHQRLEAALARIRDAKKELLALKKTQAERAAELDRRETAAGEHEAYLAERHRLLEDGHSVLQREKAAHETLVREHLDQVGAANDEIEHRTAAADARDDELASRAAALGEREDALDRREGAIGEREEELRQLGARLAARERRLSAVLHETADAAG